ncbi:hypothetical protein [Streptomyces profundus]|uniref:hypothetical protein n=1 Tax=Streptomyces profundus TaxID=2867410 RepID=UPI001D16104A|nr:hypothetical protein [Streptomyces sp. MA3_2.13]UED86353.1 hypothetical protein K4G22_20920 [Streptomyces sp. MA3_2.13]
MDAHTYVRASKNADIRRGAPVLLAQLPHRIPLDGPSDRLPGFFYRAHRLLSDSTGMLLVACRQYHEAGGELVDPCGEVVAAARGAGFVYRQHVLVVHAFAHDGCLHPTPDAPSPIPRGVAWRHRTIHTDLLVFTPA